MVGINLDSGPSYCCALLSLLGEGGTREGEVQQGLGVWREPFLSTPGQFSLLSLPVWVCASSPTLSPALAILWAGQNFLLPILEGDTVR